jgi:hypothetical protein
LLTLTATVLSIALILGGIRLFACKITVTCPGHTDSKNSCCEAFISAECSIAKEMDGDNKMKFLLSGLCLRVEIFLHALVLNASQPRPHTPSVGWINILPAFSQLDASIEHENSFKLFY